MIKHCKEKLSQQKKTGGKGDSNFMYYL